MSYLALYRKYRPVKFEDVVGQEAIIKTLKNAIKSEKICHAYLFEGPRGTGKTSVAKIFAKTVNCLSPKDGEACSKCDVCKSLKENDIDIIEIDAASNNGVDEIREIRNNVKLVPTIGHYKIYIIDEVHMLSMGAFNALLKTLEEPPKHVIFILATTEVQKIPLTIVSRCQKFDFKKINNKSMKMVLKKIIKIENKKVSDDVLSLIAEISDGGLRDAINILDQLISNGEEPTIEDIYSLSGELPNSEIEHLFDCIIERNIPEILKLINEYYESGKNLTSIVDRLLILTKNVNINNNVKDYFEKEVSANLEKYSAIQNTITNLISRKLITLSNEIKKVYNQKILFEITILDLIEEINEEKKIKSEINLLKKEDKKSDKKQENFKIISREIISIRVNNCLADANKDELTTIKDQLLSLSDHISNKKYNKIVNILLTGSVVVASKKHLIFQFNKDSEVSLFLNNLEIIEKFLKETLNKRYKVIAITTNEWKEIKKEYIENTKNGIKYILKDEPKMNYNKVETSNFAVDIFGEENIDIK